MLKVWIGPAKEGPNGTRKAKLGIRKAPSRTATPSGHVIFHKGTGQIGTAIWHTVSNDTRINGMTAPTIMSLRYVLEQQLERVTVS